ncbi:tetratricopeptide repeat protein [Flavobacterium agrisoli]|uniref:Tetratricopeptide repeat protein n=1 Tax=Flavobacterium agrisoli TaxID=2793066 RepID=A0A934UJ38_9FLAO|nr:tetratricopeptide repeat protein [Flavobacterium agrisoli]MBK0369556.1 tetratricopeptide repeat protein [Flavobacterium agrisoli]
MRKRILIAVAVLGYVPGVLAQTEPEDVAMATDAYQDSFYESLLQKGIENYDKAIVSLEKCLQIKPNDDVSYFELGKNYLALKDYSNAKRNFEQAIKINPSNKWYWLGVYDVSFQTKDYPLAINTIQKIIPFDEEYKDDLISLYMITEQPDKALALIKEMDDKYGKSPERSVYKSRILSQGNFQDEEIDTLISNINQNPKEESNYIALIAIYGNRNELDKVIALAKQLEKEIPNSEWAQVSLYKSYLDQNRPDKALPALYTVLGSSTVDMKIKHRAFNEFLIFVSKNPQYESELDKAILYFKDDTTVDVSKEVGKFFQNKKQFDKAAHFYEQAEKTQKIPDVETNLLLMQTYTETKQFAEMEKQSQEMIATFPSQPEFYFYNGLANNQLKQFKKAKDVLEIGIDYVVDDPTAEVNFNVQLGEAYNGLGDVKKKQLYFDKANLLLQKN